MPSWSTSSFTGSDTRVYLVGYGDSSLQDYLERVCVSRHSALLNRLHELHTLDRL